MTQPNPSNGPRRIAAVICAVCATARPGHLLWPTTAPILAVTLAAARIAWDISNDDDNNDD